VKNGHLVRLDRVDRDWYWYTRFDHDEIDFSPSGAAIASALLRIWPWLTGLQEVITTLGNEADFTRPALRNITTNDLGCFKAV